MAYYERVTGSLTQYGGTYKRITSYTSKKRNLPLPHVSAIRRVDGSANGFVTPGMASIQPVFPSRLVSSLYSRYREDNTQFMSLGVSLYESKETYSLVASRLVQLIKHANSLRRGDLSPFFKGLSKLRTSEHKQLWSKGYLEASFGWLPIMNDISDALYLNDNKSFDSKRSVKSTAEAWSQIQYPTAWKGSGPDTSYKGVLRVKSNFKSRYQLRWNSVISDSNLSLAADLGLTNPITTLYNIVPFSFVLNWVVDIETWLKQFEPIIGQNHSNFSTSGHTTGYHEVYYRKALGEPSFTCNTYSHDFSRGVGKPPQAPTLPSVTSFRRGLSVGQALSASALLITIFGEKR